VRKIGDNEKEDIPEPEMLFIAICERCGLKTTAKFRLVKIEETTE